MYICVVLNGFGDNTLQCSRGEHYVSGEVASTFPLSFLSFGLLSYQDFLWQFSHVQLRHVMTEFFIPSSEKTLGIALKWGFIIFNLFHLPLLKFKSHSSCSCPCWLMRIIGPFLLKASFYVFWWVIMAPSGLSSLGRAGLPAFGNLLSQGWFSKPLIMLVLPLRTFSSLSVSFLWCPGKNSTFQLNPNQYGLNLPMSRGYVKILNITYWNSCAGVTLIGKIINIRNLNLAFRTI